MSKRIANDGGSYDFYHRDSVEFTIEEELEQRTFISSNKVENSIQGMSLGNGEFLHEGSPAETEDLKLDGSVELTGKVTIAERQKARIEHAHSTEALEDYSKELDDKIVSAKPHFDFQTNKAELLVTYANGKSKVVKASCYKVATWLMNESIKDLID